MFISDDERAAAILLGGLPPLSAADRSVLHKHFPALRDVVRTSSFHLRAAGMSERAALAIAQARRMVDADAILSQCARHDITVVPLTDESYPTLLKETHRPPLCLYWRGAQHRARKRVIAMVGSRLPTAYGRETVHRIIAPLPHRLITTVSGMAVGIDALAHTAALDHGGTTIAVLGSGLDKPSWYPRENADLALRILESGGALVAEYPPGTEPKKQHFPARNRIIAGMSHATIVIEARAKSGALITARSALDENRDVLAVPGPITSPTTAGTNGLIKQGAYAVCTPEDICDVLALPADAPHEQPEGLSRVEQTLVRLLADGALPIDTLTEGSGSSASAVLSALASLELKGLVHRSQGDVFASSISLKRDAT